MGFPWLFPYGTGLLGDFRPTGKMSAPEYYKHLMHYHDRRFSTDSLFVFWATNTVQRAQALKAISIASTKLASLQTSNPEFSLNTGLLRRAGAAARSGAARGGASTIDQEAHRLLHFLAPYFDDVKDSAPFWKQRRKEVLAMLSSSALPIKTPTWFVTFSPSDLFWPELFALIDPELIGDRLHNLTKAEREQLLADNADLAILCFKQRWESLFTNVILGPLKPLGTVTLLVEHC